MKAIALRLGCAIDSRWKRYEGPTWLVAMIVYGGWISLVWFHAAIPWWLMIPLGGAVIGWHNSLQHETIHALVRVPRRLRSALALPPLGLVVPYPIYRRSHRKHHSDSRLTDPLDDPESYYHREERWNGYAATLRTLYLFNQTLVGRLTVGPLTAVSRFVKREAQRLASGDGSTISTWVWHGVSVGLLLFWVVAIAGMPLWQYVCFVVYPGLSLGMLRSFGEHRYAVRPAHRTAVVESGFPLRLLFLNNNLHLVHHLWPALPWYRIPPVWRDSRTQLLEHNGGLYYQSYSEIGRRHAFDPIFVPIHPRGEPTPAAGRITIRSASAT